MAKKKRANIVPGLLLRLFGGLLFIISLSLLVEHAPGDHIKYYILPLLIVSLLLDIFDSKYEIYTSYFRHLKEKTAHFSSQTYFLLGITLILPYLDTRIVFIVAAMTLIGTIGGQMIREFYWKQIPLSPVIQGMLIAFLLNVCGGLVFVSSYLVIIPMAITATLIESFASSKEDNLLIPIIAGMVGHIILTIII